MIKIKWADADMGSFAHTGKWSLRIIRSVMDDGAMVMTIDHGSRVFALTLKCSMEDAKAKLLAEWRDLLLPAADAVGLGDIEAEREACALICDKEAAKAKDEYASTEPHHVAEVCAWRIRDRSEDDK